MKACQLRDKSERATRIVANSVLFLTPLTLIKHLTYPLKLARYCVNKTLDFGLYQKCSESVIE